MAQTSRPEEDIDAGSWTPVPVFQQINELAPDCSTKVESDGTVPFDVKLAALVKPKAGGDQQLTVRLRSTDVSPGIWAFISLYQEDRLILFHTEMNPGTSFINVVLTLTQAQIQQITDYSKLSVQVEASPIPPPSSSSSSSSSSSGGGLPTTCCPDLPSQLTATLQNGVDCPAVDGATIPLTYSSGSDSWVGSANLECGNSIALEFYCDGNEPDDFKLDIDFQCHGGGSGLMVGSPSCEPLFARFMSLHSSTEDCLCCKPASPTQFYVTVTL